MSKAFTSSFTR